MDKQIKMLSERDYNAFSVLANDAFPGLNADKWLAAHVSESPDEKLYGVYAADQKLVAGMRTFDFRMNFNGTEISAGGVGMIAVGLLHKKERNAYHLMQYFFRQCDGSNTNLLMLNPFKVSFYRKMGFGIGTRVFQFHIKPEEFYNYLMKNHLVELSLADKERVCECYNRVYDSTHGMTRRPGTEREMGRPFNFGKVIGYVEDQVVKGYMVLSIEEDELYIHEFFFETSDVVQEFSTFLHSQADQFRNVIINSCNDDIIHMVGSPESGSAPMTEFPSSVEQKHIAHVGAGVMYRIVNCYRFFNDMQRKGHRFGRETISLKIDISDDFYQENNCAVIIDTEDGYLHTVRRQGQFDVELRINISEFSSLVMGAVRLNSLLKWGSAEMSDLSYASTVSSLFRIESLPTVTKAF